MSNGLQRTYLKSVTVLPTVAFPLFFLWALDPQTGTPWSVSWQVRQLAPWVAPSRPKLTRDAVFDGESLKVLEYGDHTLLLDARTGALRAFSTNPLMIPPEYFGGSYVYGPPGKDKIWFAAQVLSSPSQKFVATELQTKLSWFLEERVRGLGTEWGPQSMVSFWSNGELCHAVVQPAFNFRIPKNPSKLPAATLRSMALRAYLERHPDQLDDVRDFGYRWLGRALQVGAESELPYLSDWIHPSASKSASKGFATLGYSVQVGLQIFLLDAADGRLLRHLIHQPESGVSGWRVNIQSTTMTNVLWKPWNGGKGGSLTSDGEHRPRSEHYRVLLVSQNRTAYVLFEPDSGLVFQMDQPDLYRSYRPDKSLLAALQASVKQDPISP